MALFPIARALIECATLICRRQFGDADFATSTWRRRPSCFNVQAVCQLERGKVEIHAKREDCNSGRAFTAERYGYNWIGMNAHVMRSSNTARGVAMSIVAPAEPHQPSKVLRAQRAEF
jgi:hypothetical protein